MGLFFSHIVLERSISNNQLLRLTKPLSFCLKPEKPQDNKQYYENKTLFKTYKGNVQKITK